jgi:hypothetical protein
VSPMTSTALALPQEPIASKCPQVRAMSVFKIVVLPHRPVVNTLSNFCQVSLARDCSTHILAFGILKFTEWLQFGDNPLPPSR